RQAQRLHFGERSLERGSRAEHGLLLARSAVPLPPGGPALRADPAGRDAARRGSARYPAQELRNAPFRERARREHRPLVPPSRAAAGAPPTPGIAPAWPVATDVLPRYFAALEPARPAPRLPAPRATVTLVRWPYT